MNKREPELAFGAVLRLAGLGRSLNRLGVEEGGFFEVLAPILELPERDQVLGNATGKPDGLREFECSPELTLGGIEVAEQQVQLAHVVQGLQQFGLRVHILIDGERGAVQLKALVVMPGLDEAVALAAHPVGLVLLHARLLRECDRLVEMLDRLVDLAKSQAA